MIKVSRHAIPVFFNTSDPTEVKEKSGFSIPSQESQITTFEAQSIFPIQSPCQRKCHTNKKGFCTTCYRSRNERFQWLEFSDAQKMAILEKCKRRRRAVHQRMLDKAQEKAEPITFHLPKQLTLLNNEGQGIYISKSKNVDITIALDNKDDVRQQELPLLS